MSGKNIDEHFKSIAKQQSEPYIDLLNGLGKSGLVAMPKKWVFEVSTLLLSIFKHQY
jgi:hypothetical protein